jgi:hypothetical protein
MTVSKLNKDPRGKKFKERHEGKLFQVEVDALSTLRPIEFKECLLSKDKESRVKWLEEKARSIYAYLKEGMPPAPISFDDLKEFSKILIEIQLLKKNIAKFEDEL